MEPEGLALLNLLGIFVSIIGLILGLAVGTPEHDMRRLRYFGWILVVNAAMIVAMLVVGGVIAVLIREQNAAFAFLLISLAIISVVGSFKIGALTVSRSYDIGHGRGAAFFILIPFAFLYFLFAPSAQGG